jgi:hypothetical protein
VTQHAHTSRRRFLATGAALALAGGSILRVAAQESTPVAVPTGDADAVKLLNDAATTMTELDSFAFEVETVRGETTILEGLTLKRISGVVRRPADFETTVSVEIPFASIDLTAVSVGNEVWIELPNIGDNAGGWTSLGSSEGLLSLVNPDVLLLRAVTYIDDATIDRTGDIDGVDVTYVAGTVDFRTIAGSLVDDQASELQDQIAEDPAEVTVAIDDEHRVREIEIIGPLLATEDAKVIRLVTFSDFNEPVEITKPDV